MGSGAAFSISQLAASKPPSDETSDAWALLKAQRTLIAAREGERDFELQGKFVLPTRWYERLAPHSDDVREAMVLSALTLEHDPSLGAEKIRHELAPADGEKCARCWKYLPLGSDPQHPSLCAPCAEIVRAI